MNEDHKESIRESEKPMGKEGFKRELTCVICFLAVTIVIMILASH